MKWVTQTSLDIFSPYVMTPASAIGNIGIYLIASGHVFWYKDIFTGEALITVTAVTVPELRR